jgi:predicted HicB family RNase H-like nuclease
MKYKIPKYPRVMVSLARHKALTIEAEKRGISIAQLVEEKLKNKN